MRDGFLRLLFAAIAIAIATLPLASFADEPATGKATSGETTTPQAAAVELAPIQIEAERQEEKALVERTFDTPDDVAGFGETIFAEPMWRSFETPAELLGQSVGAQIRRQGGRDDFSTLTIRGAPSAQVRILLDGVALGRATDSVVNLADLPMDLVDRIEIYRGFSPVSLTPVSAAGVVNIVTRDPERATASAAVGAGSFESAKVNASGAGPVAGGSASAFASYRHTKGNFDYVDDNGTLEKRSDDTVHKRRNNDADAIENLLRWRRGLTDTTKLQLRNHLFYKEEGVPGLARNGVTSPDARLETVREIAASGVGSRDGRWSAEQIVTWERKRLSQLDALVNNTGETTASTTAARWGRPLGKSNWLSGSGEYTWEGFDQDHDLASAPDQQADRSSLAIAAGDDWTFDPVHTTLSMQLRHQELWNDSNSPVGDSDDRSTDPRLGLRWEPFAGIAIKSNVSTYFRPPNFDELYGTDGFTTGNPALKPETGTTWDAGFEWTAERAPYGKIQTGYSYFGSDIDDMIIIRQDVDRRAKAFNEAKAKIRGHEFRVEWSGPWGFAVSANYTHQDPRNDSPDTNFHGKELAGIAPNEGWARLSWSHGLFVFAYDVDVTGSHFTEPSNVQPRKLPSRTEHGVSVVYGPFLQGFRLTLEAENLGNSLVPDEIGFPLPGRAFYATLSWSPPRSEDTRAN